MLIEKLPWDSDFFGLQIGKVVVAKETTLNLSEAESFDLLYFFVSPEDEGVNRMLTNMGAVLVDKKTTFCKSVAPHDCEPECIYPYYRLNSKKDADVVNIGIQSGIYSRFKVDTHFKPEDFVRLYETWINRAIDREIAKEVFISEDGDRINGVVTVGEKNGRLDIGIIAVDHFTRGKRIGSNLIRKVEAYALQNGFKEVQVVTQKDNFSACNFYVKSGFSIESVVNIYHLWVKKVQ